MRIILLILGFLGLVYVGLVYSGWGQKLYWNQKYIIEIETPEGIVSSETVLQYRTARFPKRLNKNTHNRVGQFGEAPFIKLPNGRYLFALSLYGVYDVPFAYRQHLALGTNADHFGELFPRIAASEELVELFPSRMPLLITFEDINDPSTVRQVQPAFLRSEFGSGYKFKRFDIVTTNEQPTYGRIAEVADWMIYSNRQFNPNYKGLDKAGEKIGTFNRSVLTRNRNCKIDGFLINNLTYGLRTRGLFCSY